jgi:hypothetical protein
MKIVFQLQLLSERASPQLREPDKLRTFVSSPHIAALRTRVDGRITELLEVTKAAPYDAGRLAEIIAGKAENAAERTAPVTTEQTPA